MPAAKDLETRQLAQARQAITSVDSLILCELSLYQYNSSSIQCDTESFNKSNACDVGDLDNNPTWIPFITFIERMLWMTSQLAIRGYGCTLTRVEKRESVELVVTHCVPATSYTMNIDNVIAIQLHFVVYGIWLQPTLPS